MDFIFAFSKPKIFKRAQKREKNNSNFGIYVFVPVSRCVSHILGSTCGSFLLVAKLIVMNRFQWYDANVS